jgi:hypothetical protein
MNTLLFAMACFLLLTLALIFARGLRWAIRFRGDRLVTCPETRQPAAVRVDAAGVSVTAAMGEPVLRLRQCSRWPEREDCGEDCLRQIRNAPEDCLVRNIVTHWYAYRRCALCGHVMAPLHWHDHPPALLSADGVTVQWNQVPLAMLPQFFETHRPVCWNCHIAQLFLREHEHLSQHSVLTVRDR